MTEEERVERFEASYNRIDHALTELVHLGRRRHKPSFSAKVRMLANQQRRYGRFADFLLEVGELRNALVHNRTADEMYLAVPNEQTVLELERIEQRMLDPERVMPRFQSRVISLTPETTLAKVWEQMSASGHSRFPIYGREGFVGLLTPNGVSRFCAAQTKAGHLAIDATAVVAAHLLEHEHRRDRVAFVARDALIDEVDDLYSLYSRRTGRRAEPRSAEAAGPLEAVIITEHGRLTEKPLGIICATDVAALGD